MPTLIRQAEIVNAEGLHPRPADQFVRLARHFRAQIRVSCGDKHADGKGIPDLATLAAGRGTGIELDAVGLDAEEAVAALAALIEAGFREADP
jgi:phosphocarrier protein